MTIEQDDRRKEHPGNGVATVFVGPRAFTAGQIAVYLVDAVTQVAVLQTGNYTLTGLGARTPTTATMDTAPPTGKTLLLLRTTPYEQDTDITNQGRYQPEILEGMGDKLSMQIQQLAESQSRSITLSETYVGTPPNMDLPAPEANKAIGWNPTATALINMDGGGGGGDTDPTLRADLGSAAGPAPGASLVVTKQAGAGAVARTIQAKLLDLFSVKDYGAKGDGVTNDTAAVQAALNYIVANGGALHFPAGIYLVSATLACGKITSGKQVRIYGDGGALTQIKATAAVTGAVLKISDLSLMPGYSGSVWISDLGIVGAGIATTGFGFKATDMVHSHLERIFVTGCGVGIDLEGGICNDLSECFAYGNGIGFNVHSWSSGGFAGHPNIHNLLNCKAKDNPTWGIQLDGGRMLNILNADIEGNGTAGNAATGAVRIGANVNAESPSTDGPGLTMRDSWIEANAGGAAIVFESGVNTIDRCFFVANAGATYDVRIKGGTYYVMECDFDTNKPNNLYEDAIAAVKPGNKIIDTQIQAYQFDINKTQRLYGHRIVKASTVANTTLQMGEVLGVGGGGPPAGDVTVYFNDWFAAGTTPRVFTQIQNLSSTTMEQTEVHTITNTSFVLRRKSVATPPGTTMVNGSFYVSWVAIGQMA